MARARLSDDAPRRDGDAQEAAAYWDARLRSAECTPADREAYQAWRDGDPAHAQAFERLQDMLEALRGAGQRPVLRALRDVAVKKRARRFLAFGLSAAAIVVAALTGFAFTPLPGQPGYGQAAQTETPRVTVVDAPVHVYETAVGERRAVTLVDGSVVTLDTHSRLEERFGPGRRDVTLVAGQALFHVSHDASRPFVVAAGDRRVTAIGTQFDVRLDGERVRVVLVEGRVAVERRPQGRLVDAVIAERRELSPGQSYSAGDGLFQPVAVRQTDVNADTLWQEGRVSFADASLPDAIAEINRYARGSLVVADPSMAELRVNGVFRTDSPDAFVNALQEYYPIEARKQPGGDTLLVWRR